MKQKRNIIEMIIGFLAGLVSGLFTSGGGMILVPAFIYVLKMEEVEARATSIFCILPMVITSSLFYFQYQNLDWKLALLCALGGAMGGIIGSKFLVKVPEKHLKICFMVFLSYASFKMIVG